MLNRPEPDQKINLIKNSEKDLKTVFQGFSRNFRKEPETVWHFSVKTGVFGTSIGQFLPVPTDPPKSLVLTEKCQTVSGSFF